MRKENRYYDLFPRIVGADRKTEITVLPLFEHCEFAPGASYEIVVCPMEFRHLPDAQDGVVVPVTPKGKALKFQYRFAEEQQFRVLLRQTGSKDQEPVAEFRIYALEEDLFIRRPYKGELHTHSNRSDGAESPAYVAAHNRTAGMDFLAITDHGQYAPSIEAINAYKNAHADLKLFPGEEIHPGNFAVHTVNFGGNFSVNECLRDKHRFDTEVAAIEKEIPPFAREEDGFTHAASLWTYRKIQEAGGLSIFCHPYWVHRHRYNTPEELTTRHLQEIPFDAYEITSGFDPFYDDANSLQVARYHETRAEGRRLPIVGVTDCHSVHGNAFGTGCTVVLSLSPDLQDLIQSVKGLFSVAMETFPGTPLRVHGPFRLVKYVHFLAREVFPHHDELCMEEGRLMLAHAAGDSTAAKGLHALQGQTSRLYDHYWADTKH